MYMKKDGSYRFNLKFPCDSEKNIKAGELLEKCGNKKSILLVEALNEYIINHPELADKNCEVHIIRVSRNAGYDDNGKNVDMVTDNKKEPLFVRENKEVANVKDTVFEDGVAQMLNNLGSFLT